MNLSTVQAAYVFRIWLFFFALKASDQIIFNQEKKEFCHRVGACLADLCIFISIGRFIEGELPIYYKDALPILQKELSERGHASGYISIVLPSSTQFMIDKIDADLRKQIDEMLKNTA